MKINQVTSGSFEIYKSKGAMKFYFAQPRIKKIGQNKSFGNVVGDRYTVDRTGSIIIDCCPSIPPKNRGDLPVTQWDKKITFSLGVNDIVAIIGYRKLLDRLILEYGNVSDAVQAFSSDKYPKTSLSLTHKYTPRDQSEELTKRLNVRPGVDKYEGTYQVSMSSYKGSDYKNSQNVNVPFSGGEFEAFMILVQESLPDVLLWGSRAVESTINMSTDQMLEAW
jgi:hypothetical protein